jgi:glycosyltransferase involved in cell wall biosynthesis
MNNRRPRIAIVSPFLDKRHGTERCVAEQIERLWDNYEIHIYSADVRDLDLAKVVWHKTGFRLKPQLFTYAWFLVANHIARAWDRKVNGLDFDIVFSPGINCFDADIIAVHIVFAEYCRLAGTALSFRRNRIGTWLRLTHRKLSYALFTALERRIYPKQRIPLIVISHKMEQDLERSFERTRNLYLLYHGIDPSHMNPERRAVLREQSRSDLGIPPEAFTILLIGNDWKKKGLFVLLEAVSSLNVPDLCVLVRGDDDSSSCQEAIYRLGLGGRVKFLESIPEIDCYYAAADLYTAPSLEDSFAIPPLEAMACGLPVIVSVRAGVSELIVHGENGFILDDPTNDRELAALIRTNYENPKLRSQVGLRAAVTAQEYTWARNGASLKKIIGELLQNKMNSIPSGKLGVLAKT